MKKTFFVSGINTDVGKTVVTGYLAKQWLKQGYTVITQKLVQTGNRDISQDIVTHRQIMGIDLTLEDKQKLTMPQIFSYPASPHLASSLENKTLDLALIQASTKQLQANYDILLIEGAGGLMTPLTEQLLTVDYVVKCQYAVILVTNTSLGSINQTLLNLELLKNRGLPLAAMVLNHYYDSNEALIAQNSLYYLEKMLKKYYSKAKFIKISNLSHLFGLSK